ncbi:hypothetical protein JCM10207_004804 [Rhodosporidiobolus poonsookiae]
MSKAAADRAQRQLLELLKLPGNEICADCKTRNPRWASWDQGVFLCVQCASMHRKIGSHITKVKSVTLDTWTREQVENMRRLGNAKVNATLNPDKRRNPPPPPDSGDERNSQLERFIRNKYEYRTFAGAAPSTNGVSSTPAAPSTRAPAPSASPAQHYAPPPNPPPSHPSRPSQSPAAYAPPPGPPPPAASSSSGYTPSYAPPSFPPPAAASSAFSSLAAPTPALPPRPATTSAPPLPARAGPKSVRFGSFPPLIIRAPSPSPDSDDSADEDGSGLPALPRRRATLSRAARAPARGVLRTRAGDEILVDWGAFTRSLADEGDEDDVPLAALGALGQRGAQVGMAGVAVPYGAPGAMGYQMGGGMGGPAPAGAAYGAPQTVAPLMPQFTGSAKGYLHQQRAEQQYAPPQPLAPQMTGSVPRHHGHAHAQSQAQGQGQGGVNGSAFQQMFQPPPPPASGSPAPPNFHAQPGTQSGLLQPQATGPPPSFAAQLFNRNAYSPSPQPSLPQAGFNPSSAFLRPQSTGSPFGPGPGASPSHSPFQQPPPQAQAQAQPPAPSPLQPQPTATQKAMNDIWADLDLLGGGGGGSAFSAPAQPPAPSPSFAQPQQQQQQTPQPLKPQLTGFVPSSAFGQQLARETGGGGGNGGQPSLSLQIPSANGGASTPSPLQQQRTGFGPPSSASSFGSSLFPPHSPASSSAAPQPLQPQRTGFVPSSAFGQQLAGEFGAAAGRGSSFLGAPAAGPGPGVGGSRSVSPAPFDLSPSPARSPAPQPQPPSTNPFLSFPSTLASALPHQPPPPPQHQQQPSYLQPHATAYAAPPQRPTSAGGTNPFLSLGPGASSFTPFNPQQQQPGQGQGQGMLQPQLTGFGGAGGGMVPQRTGAEGNPFLAMQEQQGGRGVFGAATAPEGWPWA